MQEKKNFITILKKYAEILTLISVFIAAISFITSLYPGLKFWSNDYLEKANAGHIKSQFFLAEHYRLTGNYEQSIYWYTIASTNAGRDQRIACNNLGWLYANGYGLSDHEKEGNQRFERAYLLFKIASERGLECGTYNMKLLICKTDKELFSQDVRSEIQEYLDKENVKLDSLVIKSYYESFDSYRGPRFTDANNIEYTYSGSYTAVNSETKWTTTRYMYYARQFLADVDIEREEFQLSPIEF